MSMLARKFLRIGIGIAIVGAMIISNQPVLAASCPARSAVMPVIGWLVNHADSVTIHHLKSVSGGVVDVSGYPKSTTSPNFVNGLLKLSGSYVKWNGYGAPSPFGTFYYPRWGDWYAKYELRVGQDVRYIWMWRSFRYNTGNLLVFTFSDLAQSADSQGQHTGEHNFCVTTVPLRAINRLEKSAR